MKANGKITKELKALGLKINGVEPNGTTISELIKGIANDYITPTTPHLYKYSIRNSGNTYDETFVFDFYSNINCNIDNTDEGPFTQEERTSLYNLLLSIMDYNSGGNYTYFSVVCMDTSITDNCKAYIQKENYSIHIIFNTQNEGDITDVIVGTDTDHEITNDTGYIYISKKQIF